MSRGGIVMDFKPVVTISWELLFQIINTVILFLVLKKLLFKPVLNIIEKRENMIQDDLATGAKAKKNFCLDFMYIKKKVKK